MKKSAFFLNPSARFRPKPGIVKSQRKTKRNREFRQSLNFPYLCCVFLPHRIAHIGILTAPPGFVRAGFLQPSTVVWIPRPHLGRQFRPILAQIIVLVQSPIKAGFQLVTDHRFRVQFDARCVNFFTDVQMQGPFKCWVNVQVANLNKGAFDR